MLLISSLQQSKHMQQMQQIQQQDWPQQQQAHRVLV
jgi:hypothetical protein